MKVVVFKWDCGATTGITMEASVLQADRRLPDGGGNVFATDDHWGENPSTFRAVLGVRWIDDGHVMIRYPLATGVLQKLKRSTA
jgi:hypothetical protein